MKNFKDVDRLCAVLKAAYQDGEGDPGRQAFKQALRDRLGFNETQAELYATKVLSGNVNGSAAWVSMNAWKMIGTWVRGDMTGTAGSLVVTKTETWQFNEDLTYRHGFERYEGYVSPFGSTYAAPSSSADTGIWAPCDWLDDNIQLVAIAATGWCRPIKIGWLGSTDTLPHSCSLNGARFTKE